MSRMVFRISLEDVSVEMYVLSSLSVMLELVIASPFERVMGSLAIQASRYALSKQFLRGVICTSVTGLSNALVAAS